MDELVVATSAAAGQVVGTFVTFPLDVVKTRIQTRPGVYAGFGDALTRIREEEGFRMLLQGAGATHRQGYLVLVMS